MDKNTFWSQTAPSYDLVDYDEHSEDIEQICNRVIYPEDATTSYAIVSFDDEDESEKPVIEVMVFHTANVEQKDLKEKKFQFFRRKK